MAATAGATVRHLVTAVFDRCGVAPACPAPPAPPSRPGPAAAQPPPDLPPAVGDAYLLFQDLVQLVNADQPLWLQGIVEMTRTFGLELLETLLSSYSEVFTQHPPFRLLLKERVCPLVIKLFSPNIKYASSSICNCLVSSLYYSVQCSGVPQVPGRLGSGPVPRGV